MEERGEEHQSHGEVIQNAAAGMGLSQEAICREEEEAINHREKEEATNYNHRTTREEEG